MNQNGFESDEAERLALERYEEEQYYIAKEQERIAREEAAYEDYLAEEAAYEDYLAEQRARLHV